MPREIHKMPRKVQREFLKSLLVSNLVNHGETVEVASFSSGGGYHFHPVEVDFSGMSGMSEQAGARGGLLARLGLGGKSQPKIHLKSKVPGEAEQKEIEKALRAGALTAEQSERAKVLRAQGLLAEAGELADGEDEKDIAWCDDRDYADKRKSLCDRAAAHRKAHERGHDTERLTAATLDPKVTYENDISTPTRSAEARPRVMTPKN